MAVSKVGTVNTAHGNPGLTGSNGISARATEVFNVCGSPQREVTGWRRHSFFARKEGTIPEVGSSTQPRSDGVDDISKIPPEVRAFAVNVKAMVEGHQWDNFLKACDPKQYQLQKDIGQEDAVYIAERLGMHEVGNDIAKGDEKPDYTHLNRIKQLRFDNGTRDSGVVSGSVVITGIVILDDNSQLKLTMEVVKIKGRYHLTGAFG